MPTVLDKKPQHERMILSETNYFVLAYDVYQYMKLVRYIIVSSIRYLVLLLLYSCCCLHQYDTYVLNTTRTYSYWCTIKCPWFSSIYICIYLSLTFSSARRLRRTSISSNKPRFSHSSFLKDSAMSSSLAASRWRPARPAALLLSSPKPSMFYRRPNLLLLLLLLSSKMRRC